MASRSAYVNGVTRPFEELGIKFLQRQGSIVVMSKATPRKKQHPATCSEEDARRLVRMFTQEGQSLLILTTIGIGSAAIACAMEMRACTGFDLYEQWRATCNERVDEVRNYSPYPIQLGQRTLSLAMKQMDAESQDFILTAPQLGDTGRKQAKKERSEVGLLRIMAINADLGCKFL